VFCHVRPAAGESEVFRRKDSYRRTKGRSCTGRSMLASESLPWAFLAGEIRSV
jgi:hypothetical protein